MGGGTGREREWVERGGGTGWRGGRGHSVGGGRGGGTGKEREWGEGRKREIVKRIYK